MASFSPYPTEPERPLWLFILASLLLFSLGLMLAGFYRPPQEPEVVEVELTDMQAVNEPPPLGDPEAGATPPPASTPEPTPEQTPEPTPVPTPEMTPEMTPEPTPEFIKPDLTPPPTPPPTPKPTPAPTATPKPAPKPAPKQTPVKPAPAQAAQSTSNNPNAKVGVKGVPNGKVGGKGGSKGDFTSTPQPEYDSLSYQRRYQGTGTFVITYSSGRITNVEIKKSTGVLYLDKRTVNWIKTQFKLKPGVSGTHTYNWTWQLPR